MSDTEGPIEMPLDAAEADVIEQQQSLYDLEPEPGPSAPIDADPADLAEQRTPAGVDDDEW